IKFRFLIHVFPARRLSPPVLMAELPARPNAAASALRCLPPVREEKANDCGGSNRQRPTAAFPEEPSAAALRSRPGEKPRQTGAHIVEGWGDGKQKRR